MHHSPISSRATSQLDHITDEVDRLRDELNAALRGLSDNAPLFAAVDLATAIDHLRRAAVAIDKAADQIAGDQQHAAIDATDDAWTGWQVNSTTRTCCGAIGGHARDCDPIRRLGAAAQDLDASQRMAVAVTALNLMAARTDS